MTAGEVDQRPPRLEVHAVVAAGWGGELGLWARSLDASVRSARRQALLESVVTVVVDLTATAWCRPPSPSLDGVDEWKVQTSRPAVADPAADLVLMVDVSTDLSPSCLSALLVALHDPAVGIVEPRHIPFQSRKPIDLDTGEVSWAAASCLLIRREVLLAAGGLDVDLLPDAGADVDLSWKARLAGWSVRCATAATVYDKRPVPSGEPMLEPSRAGSLARLVLAARYAGAGAAHAWVRAWRAQGHPGEREAAAEYEAELMADPPRIAPGDIDVFAKELFDLSRIMGPPPDEYDLSTNDIARRARTQAPTAGATPFLSVIVRTQGNRLAELEDNLLSLCAQDCSDFEVLLMAHDLDPDRQRAVRAVVRSFRGGFAHRVRVVDVTGGGRARPLNAGLDEAAGQYLAFLDDDDVAFGSWVATFRTVAEAYPGAVVWSRVAWQVCNMTTCAGNPLWQVTEAPKLFVREFDVLSHLVQNGTTNCAVAIPRSLIAEHGLRYREDLKVFEDWDMVLRLAQLAPFVSTRTATALYRRGSADGSGEVHGPSEWAASGSQVLDDLDRSGFFIRGEHLQGLRDALEELADLRKQFALVAALPVRAGWDESPEARLLEDGYLDGRRVMVVGPHLDDAILSCGAMLSDLRASTVLTVFAGGIDDWSQVTAWDEACGFEPDTDVLAARLREDEGALTCVGATGSRLPFLDQQYRDGTTDPTVEDLGQAIVAGVRAGGAQVAFIPLGLGHTDHRLTAAACLWAARHESDIEWFVYQDLPYAYEDDEAVEEALGGLGDVRPQPVRFPPPTDPTRKAEAIAFYRSQIMGLGEERIALALQPERYWRLTPGSATLHAQ